jgi:hypothetical protein
MSDRDTFAADEIERLRGDAEVSRLRLDAAHAEIERLRQSDRPQPIKPADATPDTHTTPEAGSVQGRCTLTVEERAAIEDAASACGNCNGFGGDPTQPAIYKGDKIAATIRSLLERTQ